MTGIWQPMQSAQQQQLSQWTQQQVEGQRSKMSSFWHTHFYLGCYQKVLPTVGVDLSSSIMAINPGSSLGEPPYSGGSNL